MLECSWLVGQLPSGLSAWPVLLTRAGTSSRVAGVAGRVGSVGVSMGRMPGCHGGPSRAGRGGSTFATRARCVDGRTGWSSPNVALLRHWAADHWSHGSTGFWRQFGSSAQDGKHIGAGARRGAGLRDLAYRVSKLFSQHCVRLVALRKPVPWTARAARRPFLFLDRFTGEVGVRGAPGPSPPCTSEVVHPSEGERDDGGLAGTLGASAGKPSAPGTYGGLVCPSLAGRESTRRDDVARAARRAVNPERLARWAARRRPSGGSGWRVELAVGPCWFLAPNG